MAVTIDDVRHIAVLARLGIDDARAASLVSELNTIRRTRIRRRRERVRRAAARLRRRRAVRR